MLESVYVALDFDSRASLARSSTVFRGLWSAPRLDPTMWPGLHADSQRYAVLLGARLFRRQGVMHHTLRTSIPPIFGRHRLAVIYIQLALRPQDLAALKSWWGCHGAYGTVRQQVSYYTACHILRHLGVELAALRPTLNFDGCYVMGVMTHLQPARVDAADLPPLEMIFNELPVAGFGAHGAQLLDPALWICFDAAWSLHGEQGVQSGHWQTKLSRTVRYDSIIGK